MYSDGWIKLINENEVINISEKVPNFMFLEAKASYPTSNNDVIVMKGVDGELPSATTFAPFNLVVKCGYDGYDTIDANLAEQELRNIFYKRYPYYIVTSDNPNIKYAVKNPDINPDYTDYKAIKFEINFSVYKGYSESLKETDEFNLSNDTWQFGNGLVIDDDIKYTHTENKFKIFNGSSDTINPLLRHKFNLKINIDAPKGFKLTNKTTGDVFEYTQPIQKEKTLNIIGLHPFIDKQRVGVNTNWQWITMEPGYNNIEITGESIENATTQWTFPFIYR